MTRIYAGLTYRVGDERPSLQFDFGEDISTFTSASATVKKPNDTTFVRAGTISDPTNGIVDLAWQAGDLDQAGNWECEMVLATAAPLERSTQVIVFHVREALA